jgi:hypothetical protein
MTSLPRVPDSELDFDSDLVFTRAGEPFTGVAFEGNPDGGRSEITYRDGIQEGMATDWYPSGQLKEESSYVQNVLHGHARAFDADGRLIAESIYEYGILVSTARVDLSDDLTFVEEIDPDSLNARLLDRYRKEKNWSI